MLGILDAGDVSVIVGSVSLMPRTNPKRRSKLMLAGRSVRSYPADLFLVERHDPACQLRLPLLIART
ncbi:hypothetical protein SAMCFNEI73_pC1721 (plasmid) [Sinorhizobium americanum]|uniref:Uncharacterized protein n=1 Tax=Sinorhizobium americanum TaxID=194963 RepID=A0A1L3LZ95_9HYPH|nr:hypothetical protein SAMCFNEI73_pC1721 [Sinorhizobium americanum]